VFVRLLVICRTVLHITSQDANNISLYLKVSKKANSKTAKKNCNKIKKMQLIGLN